MDPNDNLGVGGGAPPPSTLASLEAEEKAMRSGKGRMLVTMGAAVVAAVALLIWFMSPDATQQYREFGKKINGLDAAHFTPFMGCMLRGEDLRNIRGGAELRAELNLRAGRGGKAFGVYLRDQCSPKLADYEPKLEALIPPPDLSEALRALTVAIGALRGATSEYVAFLDEHETYDVDAAKPAVDKVIKAWFDYKVAHRAVNDGVRSRTTQ